MRTDASGQSTAYTILSSSGVETEFGESKACERRIMREASEAITMERSTKSGGWLVLICAALTAAITGCAIHYTDVSGMERSRRVVDKATEPGCRRPSWSSRWDSTRASFGANTTICARLAVVKTGADGRYMIPDGHGRVPLMTRICTRSYQRRPDEASSKQGVGYLARWSRSGTRKGWAMNTYLVRCLEDGGSEAGGLSPCPLWDSERAAARKGDEDRSGIHPSSEATQFGIDEAVRRLRQWRRRTRASNAQHAGEVSEIPSSKSRLARGGAELPGTYSGPS